MPHIPEGGWSVSFVGLCTHDLRVQTNLDIRTGTSVIRTGTSVMRTGTSDRCLQIYSVFKYWIVSATILSTIIILQTKDLIHSICYWLCACIKNHNDNSINMCAKSSNFIHHQYNYVIAIIMCAHTCAICTTILIIFVGIKNLQQQSSEQPRTHVETPTNSQVFPEKLVQGAIRSQLHY